LIRILAVASEIYPLLKTGGLGDVVGALPLALQQVGGAAIVTARAQFAPSVMVSEGPPSTPSGANPNKGVDGGP
jgi:hypothetical protein